MGATEKKNYYDIIAGLSAFESSQEVTLSSNELEELVKNTESTPETPKQVIQEDTEKIDKKRMTVHGYLGGKVDLTEATNASYDLSHTLLGGYVPKRQLESLSSIDFAHYFHKSLECENALQLYHLVMENRYRREQLENNDDQ